MGSLSLQFSPLKPLPPNERGRMPMGISHRSYRPSVPTTGHPLAEATSMTSHFSRLYNHSTLLILACGSPTTGALLGKTVHAREAQARYQRTLQFESQ